jgi:nucleoside-diphosphate-sugar epimerase
MTANVPASRRGRPDVAPPDRRVRDRKVRRVTVVGGAGYLGSVLVPLLLDAGMQVTVMDALLFGDDGVRHVAGRPGFRLVRGDLRDVESVIHACARADAVVHIGGLVGDPACAVDEATTLQVNRDATAAAARVARALGVRRFVLASTCSVYGASSGLLTEDSTVRPLSVYARSKAESEELLLPMTGRHFSPTVLRFGTLFGRSPRERFDLVVNMLAAKAVVDGEITITGGSQWRPFVHVADVADAVLRCLQAPSAVVGGRVYNVGADDENHTLADVAAAVCATVPGTTVTFAPSAATEADYRVSFERIRTELGFRSRRDLSYGIAEIAAAVREGLVGDYAEARYSNYKALLSGYTTGAVSSVAAVATTG